MPPLRRAAILTLLALLAAGCGGSSAADISAAVPRADAVAPSSTSHVVVVVMENEEASAVVGARAAPFVTRLARRYALFTRSFGVRHPSLPNYLALTSGSTHGIDSDCTRCHVSAPNLVDQLDQAGVSWRAYMYSLPHPCFTGAGAGEYAKKHDPFLYYDDVRYSRSRCANVVPGAQLGRDLSAGALPTFAWITPNLCQDGHDCSVRTADRFLGRLVPALERGLGPHGALLLTWDEGSSDAGCCGLAHGGRIATVVVGPDVRRGARIATAVTHYSTLLTIERLLGLPPLGEAGSPRTKPLDGAFTTLPRI